MSMQNDNDELTAEELRLPDNVQAELRIARKAARASEAKDARIAQLEKSSAVLAAGVPDHPAREAVFESYDGPLDPVSIREHAEKMGLMAPLPGSQGLTPEEIAAGQRIVQGAAGAPPAGSADVDLAVALRNAKSKDELLKIIGEVSGDPGFRSRDGLVGELPTGII